jgi:sulfite reductase alpha subunit-like flavoprotein
MLKERGGSRILPRVDCDVDMDAPFDQWVKNLTKRLAIDIVGHC